MYDNSPPFLPATPTSTADASRAHGEAPGKNQPLPPRALFLCWVSAGVPGALGVYSEGGLTVADESVKDKSRLSAVYGGGVSTMVGYGCYMSTPAKSGFEVGVSAPYVAYGRRHPILGDRLQLFVPMMGSVQCTSTGALGLSFSVPLFNPFVRIGLSCFVRDERMAPALRAVLRKAGRVAERVERLLAAAVAPLRHAFHAFRYRNSQT